MRLVRIDTIAFHAASIMASSHGPVVRNGTRETIVDANDETWTITADDKTHKNRQAASESEYVTELVYWDGVVHQQNHY